MSLMDLYSLDYSLENNVIFSQKTLIINNEITEEYIGKCLKALMILDKMGGKEPVKIYINTFGGSVYDGLALYDFIRNMQSVVHTYGFGKIMSMGAFLLLAGDKRFISQRSTIMIHEISDNLEGPLDSINVGFKESKRLQNILLKIFTSRTNIDKETYWKKIKADKYLTPDEALNLGFVDYII